MFICLLVALLLLLLLVVMQTITFLFLGWYANIRLGWGKFKIPEPLQVCRDALPRYDVPLQ